MAGTGKGRACLTGAWEVRPERAGWEEGLSSPSRDTRARETATIMAQLAARKRTMGLREGLRVSGVVSIFEIGGSLLRVLV